MKYFLNVYNLSLIYSDMDFGKILRIMESEGRKKDAPVFRFERERKDPFQILVATNLSARTKDETTGKVVKKLFSKIKTPEELLKLKNIEKIIYRVGFYRTKAKNLKNMSRILIEEYNSEVPKTIEELLKLPGVGRKTANIVLARAFGKNTLGVDVHVHRISNRMGLVRSKKPEETEEKLIKKVPKKYLGKLNRNFVAYGQTVCLPRIPKCSKCKIREYCKRIGIKKSQ